MVILGIRSIPLLVTKQELSDKTTFWNRLPVEIATKVVLELSICNCDRLGYVPVWGCDPKLALSPLVFGRFHTNTFVFTLALAALVALVCGGEKLEISIVQCLFATLALLLLCSAYLTRTKLRF